MVVHRQDARIRTDFREVGAAWPCWAASSGHVPKVCAWRAAGVDLQFQGSRRCSAILPRGSLLMVLDPMHEG